MSLGGHHPVGGSRALLSVSECVRADTPLPGRACHTSMVNVGVTHPRPFLMAADLTATKLGR
jgi:hypothetical protein